MCHHNALETFLVRLVLVLQNLSIFLPIFAVAKRKTSTRLTTIRMTIISNMAIGQHFDTSLKSIRKTSEGDFTSLYEIHTDLLYRYAIKLTGSTVDAQDLLQETAIRLFTHRSQFELGTSFIAWACVAMKNQFLAEIRTKNRRKSISDENMQSVDWVSDYPLRITPADELYLEDLQRVVHTLSPKVYQTFQLYSKGYTGVEISERLQISIGTVKSRVHFAKQYLQTQLTRN